MRWWLIPAAATLPLLTIACSESPPDVSPKQTSEQTSEQTPKQPGSPKANARTVVLTYFTIPG